MRGQNCMKQKKVTTKFFSWSFSLANAAMTASWSSKQCLIVLPRLTWHFSHVPSKQNRVYGPCFYLDYAPQAAKLHQSNFLLGLLLLREKKEVMRNTRSVIPCPFDTFSPIHSTTFEKYLLTGHLKFWVASLAFTHFKLVKHYIWPQLRRLCNRSLQKFIIFQ